MAREVQRLHLPMPAAVSYLGPVFRSHSGGAGEFRQAGVESFGRADTAAADADILALGLETCAIYGVPDPEILIGDVGLFSAVLEALPLAPAWRRRLMKDFGQGRLDEDIANLSESEAKGTAAVHAGVLSALAGSDPDAARALITDLLSIAGITTVGGRTVSEIAARFLEQAALEGNGLSAETGRHPLALSGHHRRPRPGAGTGAGAGERSPDRHFRRARRLRGAGEPSGCAWGEPVGSGILRRLRSAARLLQRHGVRTQRSGRARRRPAGGRRAL